MVQLNVISWQELLFELKDNAPKLWNSLFGSELVHMNDPDVLSCPTDKLKKLIRDIGHEGEQKLRDIDQKLFIVDELFELSDWTNSDVTCSHDKVPFRSSVQVCTSLLHVCTHVCAHLCTRSHTGHHIRTVCWHGAGVRRA